MAKGCQKRNQNECSLLQQPEYCHKVIELSKSTSNVIQFAKFVHLSANLNLENNILIEMRAKSAQIKNTINEVEALQQELNHQIKKSTLLDGDRKQFWKQAEDVKEKNKETIDKLKMENKRLKQLRDELSGTKKLGRTLGSNSFSNFTSEIRDENFWRRQLDKQRHSSKTKKKTLLHLQDMLREVQDSKTGYIQQSPLMKNIRVLENRLDKVMIKYNQAQSIKKTYQQIVKRLKEQRVGYDNQLAAIERSLKGKEHDFEELLLLAHDATHAKELAYTEFKKYEVKRMSVQELRSKYLEEKRVDIQRKKHTMTAVSSTDKENNKIQIKERPPAVQEMFNEREKSNYQKEDLNKYEDAFRKLKEVTGVLDSNEIIQKYKTQELTANSLMDLKKEYQAKIINLKQTKSRLKDELSNKLSKNDRNCDRQHINKLQSKTDQMQAKVQAIKFKHQRLHKLLVNAGAGLQHLNRHLQFFKVQQNMTKQGKQGPQSTLDQINKKLDQLYRIVQNDSEYSSEFFKQSAVNIEEIIGLRNKDMNEQIVLQKNNRIRNCMEDEDEISENDFDEDVNLENNLKQETKNALNVRSQGNIRKTFSKKKGLI